jgi:predicted nuclease of predicted toxin-antitoxin system
MIFFVDENIPSLAVSFLENAGHDVHDIRSTGQEGLPDTAIFALARERQALFLTTDKDFYHTIHLSSRPHYGIVVIALSRPNAKLILDKVAWFCAQYAAQDVRDTCFLISDSRCTIHH